jgi:WD40 repeat protein
MVTFIRGPATFVGPGQVYVKMLPNGESVELTHDNTQKLHPQFSFDGTRITYGTYSDREFAWDTWEVPVPGGEATRVFRNATGLTWIGPAQVLFSEIKMGVHMGVVTADENRTKSRDVYLPSSEPRMAHRSWLSPDRKWVLLDEMDDDHLWEPCRVVPFDGSGSGHKVGPSEGGCTAGAWSPDGKWMYVTSSAVDGNHIWRQRFPEGKPEQLTFGPTEEEGIAMSPDGHSFITAVALANTSLWRHDTNGEHEIPIEGNPAEVRLTPDGRKVLYRLVREPPSEFSYSRDAGELRIIDLQTGRWEPVVRNMQVVDYDISSDGQQVVIQAANSQLWLMPLDRGGPPRRIPNATGGFPRFLPDGEILFRRTGGGIAAGTSGFIYRIRPDGTGIRKALDVPVLVPVNVSPDGEWFQAWAPVGNGGPPAIQLFPLEGGNPVLVATATMFTWSPDGRYVSIASDDGILVPEGRSYVVPLPAGRTLPPIPAGGFTSEEQIASLRGARKIDIAGADVSVSGGVIPGSSPDSYVFYRGRVQRNLYRIPIY